jgi:hypothetical protein
MNYIPTYKYITNKGDYQLGSLVLLELSTGAFKVLNPMIRTIYIRTFSSNLLHGGLFAELALQRSMVVALFALIYRGYMV